MLTNEQIGPPLHGVGGISRREFHDHVRRKRIGQITQTQFQSCMAGLCPVIPLRYGNEADMAPFCELMPELAKATPAAEAKFLEAWRAFSPW